MMNVFQYGAACERYFEEQARESGYERKTTFYSDLSIAEYYGVDAILDTFNRVMESWKDDVVYFTEFVMCLNWKIWQHYYKQGGFNAKTHDIYGRLYDELWRKANAFGHEHFKGDDLSYYYRTLD